MYGTYIYADNILKGDSKRGREKEREVSWISNWVLHFFFIITLSLVLIPTKSLINFTLWFILAPLNGFEQRPGLIIIMIDHQRWHPRNVRDIYHVYISLSFWYFGTVQSAMITDELISLELIERKIILL